MPRYRRRSLREFRIPSPPVGEGRSCAAAGALLVIDNAPLQAAAWRELGEARRRLEVSARDLHRHESAEVPAFRTWLGTTFPQWVTALRDLAAQVQRDEAVVQAVMAEAYYTGRSERAVWRDRQRRPADAEPPDQPEFFDDQDPAAGSAPGAAGNSLGDDDFDQPPGSGTDDASDAAGSGRAPRDGDDDEATSARMRASYRRMAGRLHPDRGGDWTPARERLWHEVQAAWAARDADWLLRLEAEWEMATEVFGPHSALGRLQAAAREADGARRDVERKLRLYRQDPAWRFASKRVKPGFARKMQSQLEQELTMLRGAAAQLAGQLAAWDRSVGKRRRGQH